MAIALTQAVPEAVAQVRQVEKPESSAGSGPESEREAVRQVLRHYLAAVDARDKSAIARAFHPTAARIDIVSTEGASSTDMFTLLNTADGWRIINKTLSTAL